jgi:predicted metal-dependent phosphoesterase TrpH
VVGRPHVARALVAVGAASSVDEAFTTLLHHRSPYYVAKADTDAREGIGLIRAAGGVPVFAHGLATARGRVVGDDAIAAMADAGLLGLEVDHPDHAPEQREHLGGLADDLGLIRTGSSDYHGTNKRTAIAMCTTEPDQFEALLAAGRGSEPYRD